MNRKKFIYVLLIGLVGLLSIYYLLGDASSSHVQTSNSTTPSVNEASTVDQMNSAIENPFQKRLDEQKLNPSTVGVQQVGPKHVAGQDPFKAFLDAQNMQRLDDARRSPFQR